ncbi:MAG: histidinol-phosphate transaminase [Pseudomonadota bacterium]
MIINPNRHLDQLPSYQLADLAVPGNVRRISLAQNESACPPSPNALAAARKACTASLRRYPDSACSKLVNMLGQIHDLDPKSIICEAGSMALLSALCRAYIGPEDRVLAGQYGYGYCKTATLMSAGIYQTAPERNFTVDVDALLEHADQQTRMVYIANPANPTGTRLARAELVRLRDALAQHILLVIDEAYGEFCAGIDAPVFDLVERGNVVVLRSFSKAYGLAGLRIGWGVFPPAIAEILRKVINMNPISTMAQACAVAALHDQAHMRGICDQIIQIRNDFADRMRKLGLTVPESHGNFVLLVFKNSQQAAAINQMLRHQGIVLRPVAGYGLHDCLRATIGTRHEMQQLSQQIHQQIG